MKKLASLVISGAAVALVVVNRERIFGGKTTEPSHAVVVTDHVKEPAPAPTPTASDPAAELAASAMQMADARRHQEGPAPAAASGIEAGGVARQALPGKHSKIFAEHPQHFLGGKAALIEALPFAAEIADRCSIDVLRNILHCFQFYHAATAHSYGFGPLPRISAMRSEARPSP